MICEDNYVAEYNNERLTAKAIESADELFPPENLIVTNNLS
jgi:hypothetical protein